MKDDGSSKSRRVSPPIACDFAVLRRALLRWYEQHHRELPWRDIGDPYRVWISEIMLQQTTVTAVIPYYERFLARFPDVFALASAEETDVLRLWEGLGYYSRARNLHRAAQQIVSEQNGQFPHDVGKLLALPGIGRYTAGAIASFAFDEPAPIVEANTLRLYCRLLGFDGDPRSSAGQQVLWDFAAAVLPRTKPGRFNQALMDLGATVCTPAEPDCPKCPLVKYCRAFQANRVNEIPRAASRPSITDVTAYTIAIRHRGGYLLRRCQPKERWAGLWDFPRWETDTEEKSASQRERRITTWVGDFTGLTIQLGPQIAQFRHGVTRYRISLSCFLADRLSGRLRTEGEWAWVTRDQFAEYPLSTTGRKFADRLQSGLF